MCIYGECIGYINRKIVFSIGALLNDEVEKCAKHIENIKNNNNPQSLDMDFVNQIKSEILKFAERR